MTSTKGSQKPSPLACGIAACAAETRAVDITSREACTQLVDDVTATHGRIDVLVNNAGINRRGALLDLTEDDWNATFAVNLDAIFHLCRAVLPHMIAVGKGAIVNTASQWGLHPAPGHIAYNVSKAAVVAFTQNSRVTTRRTTSASTRCALARSTRRWLRRYSRRGA